MPRRAVEMLLAVVSAAAVAVSAGADSSDSLAPLTEPALSASDRAQIESGALVIRDLSPSDPDGVSLLIMGLVDAPPDQLWSVMSDCAKQHEFMPHVSYSAVHDRDRDRHVCELVVDLPFPLEPARSETLQLVRRLPDGGYQRRWELAPGDWSYRRDDGSWSVHPYADGQRSLLVNRVDVLFKSALPIWMLRAAQTHEAPAMFEAIRTRVQVSVSANGH